MDKVTVFVQAVFWAVLGFFGVKELNPSLQVIVAPALTGLAGFVGPSLIEWSTKYRNQFSAASTVVLTVVTYLVANQHMNQTVAALITAVLVAAAHLFNPSVGHPSRLAPVTPTP